MNCRPCAEFPAKLLFVQKFLGQSGNLLLEQIFRLRPDASVLPILQLQQTGKQRLTEHLGAFTREKRGKMVNTDHAKRGALRPRRQSDGYCGLVESSGDIVHGNRIVGVSAASRVKSVGCTSEKSNGQKRDSRVGAHVANDRQTAVRGRKRFNVDKWGNRLARKIDAVDEDICVDNLLERTACFDALTLSSLEIEV